MSEPVATMRGFAPLTPDRAPPASPGRGFGFAPSVVVVTKPQDIQAEAFRSLRTDVMSRHFGVGRRSLAVCAASLGAGASVVAANLAAGLSQIGLNTLLIDCDLTSPGLDVLIRAPEAQAGLSEHLASGLPPEDIVPLRVLSNFSVIYAGQRREGAGELLAGDRFRDLIDFCLRNYDATIVDTPPANRSSGAKQVSSVIGYALLVARNNTTFVKDVKTLNDQLAADGVNVVGSVLTGA